MTDCSNKLSSSTMAAPGTEYSRPISGLSTQDSYFLTGPAVTNMIFVIGVVLCAGGLMLIIAAAIMMCNTTKQSKRQSQRNKNRKERKKIKSQKTQPDTELTDISSETASEIKCRSTPIVKLEEFMDDLQYTEPATEIAYHLAPRDHGSLPVPRPRYTNTPVDPMTRAPNVCTGVAHPYATSPIPSPEAFAHYDRFLPRTDPRVRLSGGNNPNQVFLSAEDSRGRPGMSSINQNYMPEMSPGACGRNNGSMVNDYTEVSPPPPPPPSSRPPDSLDAPSYVCSCGSPMMPRAGLLQQHHCAQDHMSARDPNSLTPSQSFVYPDDSMTRLTQM